MISAIRKILAFCLLAGVSPLFCSPAAGDNRISFDVVSIKKSATPIDSFGIAFKPNRLSIKALTAKDLLCNAFGDCSRLLFQSIPAWADKTYFDIEAKVLETPKIPLDELSPPERHRMFEQLLVQYFGLKYHREMLVRPVYRLSRNRRNKTLKLTPHTASDPSQGDDPCTIHNQVDGFLSIDGCTMSELAERMDSIDGRPVVDDTGLSGRFDVRLHWSANKDTSSDEASKWPSIYVAVKEQLGLVLQPSHAPLPVIAIDTISMPEVP